MLVMIRIMYFNPYKIDSKWGIPSPKNVIVFFFKS